MGLNIIDNIINIHFVPKWEPGRTKGTWCQKGTQVPISKIQKYFPVKLPKNVNFDKKLMKTDNFDKNLMKTDNFVKNLGYYGLTLCRKWEENVRKQKLIQKCKKICQIWQKIEQNAAFDSEINIFYSVEIPGSPRVTPLKKKLLKLRSPGQITSSPGSTPDDSYMS